MAGGVLGLSGITVPVIDTDDDQEALLTVDYAGDPDWHEFVRHGALPSTMGVSNVYRLTTHAGDYKSLRQGISSLDFDRFDPALPLNAAVNLHRVPTRIAIVKKNKSVLTKLVADLAHEVHQCCSVVSLLQYLLTAHQDGGLLHSHTHTHTK